MLTFQKQTSCALLFPPADGRPYQQICELKALVQLCLLNCLLTKWNCLMLYFGVLIYFIYSHCKISTAWYYTKKKLKMSPHQMVFMMVDMMWFSDLVNFKHGQTESSAIWAFWMYVHQTKKSNKHLNSNIVWSSAYVQVTLSGLCKRSFMHYSCTLPCAYVCLCTQWRAVCPCHNVFAFGLCYILVQWQHLLAAWETSEIIFAVPPARGLRLGTGRKVWE